MAAIDFPNTPTTGDTFTVGTITWEWDGTVWNTASLADWLDDTKADLAGASFTGLVTTSNGLTNAQQKNALVASGYNSVSGNFAQASRVIMTATNTSSAEPTTRPDGTTLQIGDIWFGF
jgi:hypothetical protein